jgi:HAE1 family hydrophobic/amphiphilic exporter-1
VKTISLTYPHRETISIPELISLPVPVGEAIVPLKALAEAELSYSGTSIDRLNEEQVFYLEGRLSEKEKGHEGELMAKLQGAVDSFAQEWNRPGVSFEWVNPRVELEKALKELVFAIVISLALIFLVLFIQFNHLVHVSIVMLAIPFGFLGVLLSLYIFGSSLSLNSALGLILLNGITVANSILLVEMILRLVHAGRSPAAAITLTAEARIRPILMTSLITIMGMLPLALGYGEGGKVLQPLGIAVCGGLWVSLIFTLYLIPALEFFYLRRKHK